MDKMSQILNLMKDYKPRTLNEIEEVIGSRCSSSVTHLYQKGMLYARDIKYYMKALTGIPCLVNPCHTNREDGVSENDTSVSRYMHFE